jgi:DNA-binding transcriptional regulator YdaS (Cro superfamily)
MAEISPAQKAVDVFDGSPTRLAAAVGDGVLRQHVEHWLKSKRVPAERCPAVSKVTRIPLWELRPDDWHRIWPMLIDTHGAPAVPLSNEKAKAE